MLLPLLLITLSSTCLGNAQCSNAGVGKSISFALAYQPALPSTYKTNYSQQYKRVTSWWNLPKIPPYQRPSSSTVKPATSTSSYNKRRNTALFISSSFSPDSKTERSSIISDDISMMTSVSTTLASSFVIYIHPILQQHQSDAACCDDNKSLSSIWNLVPVSKAAATGTQKSRKASVEVGTMAMQALRSDINDVIKDNGDSILTCHLKLASDSNRSSPTSSGNIANIKVTASHSNDDDDDDDNQQLLSLLARIMIQNVVQTLNSVNKNDTVNENDTVTVCIDIPSFTSNDSKDKARNETYTLKNLLAKNGYPPLFASLLPTSMMQNHNDNNINCETIEMSDMVDSRGKILGYVPRILVHKFNLLHRGIGMVVCRDHHITSIPSTSGLPDVYVHRRTDTKRIFPSLYDMFVGGISTTGEDSRLTAAREVAEELGLKRGLPSSLSTGIETDALMGPLFKCTVCTSYNRCIVTMFTYQFKSEMENINWQEEEVAWGDFVPYHVVKSSARLSIDRLKNRGDWPGTGVFGLSGSDFDSDSKDSKELRDKEESSILYNGDWQQWDYVPDGLLVWEAWIHWMKKRSINE